MTGPTLDIHADVPGLYRRYVTLVRGRAERLGCPPECLDGLVQEAFAKVLTHRPFVGTERELAACLYRTATNLALVRLRDGARKQELLALRARPQPERGAEPPPATRLCELLALVSYDEAQVAAYVYGDGLELGEVADLLGVEPRTARAALARFDARAARLLAMTLRVRRVA